MSDSPNAHAKKSQTFLESTDSGTQEYPTDVDSVNRLGATIEPLPDEDSNSVMMVLEDSKPTMMVLFLTFLASISGFMFGYDTGYISSALVAIGDSFGSPLSYGQEQLITAATSLGAFITAVVSGLIVDFFGRKPVLMVSNILFVVGSIIQCASHTVWTMIAGRFIMGFGVGTGSLIAPLYIAELAPSSFRGRLVVLNCMGITGGQLIAYGIGAGLDSVHNGWRIVVGLSIIPPAVQFISFLFLPDTPRFLVMKNRLDEAAKIITKVYNGATPELVQEKIREIQKANSEIPGDNAFQRYWNSVISIHKVPSNFRALFLACSLQAIQQFTGFNSLMYFSATIFKAIGFDNSTAVSLIVAGTNFFVTILAFLIIDRVGRRRMLMVSLPIMMLFLVLCAISFHFVHISFDDNTAVVNGDVSAWGIVIIVFMVCYVASYAIGIGNVPWQQSELFPQSVRGLGASYATATNWVGSLVISSTFLTMLKNITPTGTFALFAALAAISIVLIYFCYPELSNLSLEEVQMVLTGGFNIKTSEKLAKKRKEQRRARTQRKEKARIEEEQIEGL
ncbi:DEKNAAC104683 [Brettanomyces naardenensis]|uniref:DEKNAAC104683 n=1 Tax=Brettanomyces naardenensis TaxID=13370 RepID=A0A448YRF2_BRENA|nr:DEKNAAC104683 [Brettanomyces naardenensis]